MYQATLNQSGNLVTNQSKKPTVRSKPDNVGLNLGGNKVAVPSQNVSRPPPRKPFKSNQKQGYSGSRDKSFSKNEKKVESRNYKQPASAGPVAVQDLLNFNYSSGRQHQHVESYRSYSHSYSASRKNKTYFNKEEYLQAKCKFVVIGTPDDYYVNTVDPDQLVDWEKVSLVYVPTNESPNCPVCLYPPTAARITKCGHIYCWSCILHYLHLEEDAKSWRKCPICHEAVHKKDLKPVKPFMQVKFDRLDSISMRLMKRPKTSIFAVPKNETEEQPKFEFPIWLGDAYDGNSKIMLATREVIIKQLLMKEREELNSQLQRDTVEENGEATFITMALNILDEEIKTLSAYEGISIPKDLLFKYQADDGINHVDESMSLSNLLSRTSMSDCGGAEAAFSDEEDEELDSQILEPLELNRDRLISECSTVSNDTSSHEDQCDIVRSPTFPGEKKTKNDSYHFYQAEDGQNIYMHSINARTLIEEYGALDDGPLKVQGQIIDFDYYTMTKELRKRFRYLSHLPLSTEFMICELILKPPLLSKRTIHNFMPEFKKRKELRSKKFKEQQKFDRQANAIENKKYGFYVDPEFDDEAFGIDLANVEDFPSNLRVDDSSDVAASVSPEPVAPNPSVSSPSFAAALNTATGQQPVWPNTKANIYTRTLPDQTTTPTSTHDEDGPDVFRPDFKATFSAAMFATPLSNANAKANESKGKGKKKKDKGTLLFATGGQRKY